MRKIFYILPLVFVISLVMACKKNKTDPTSSIFGTWQLVSAQGGFTGGPIPLPSYVITYTFKPDSTFSQTPSQRTGTFHITRHKSMFSDNMQPFITFSDSDAGGLLVTVKNDSLTLIDDHVEPVASTYLRVK